MPEICTQHMAFTVELDIMGRYHRSHGHSGIFSDKFVLSIGYRASANMDINGITEVWGLGVECGCSVGSLYFY
jgi:hypothetical protein